MPLGIGKLLFGRPLPWIALRRKLRNPQDVPRGSRSPSALPRRTKTTPMSRVPYPANLVMRLIGYTGTGFSAR
jgi:hypothetical protein